MRIGLRNLGLIFLGVVAPLSMSMATAADSPATPENAGDFAAKSKGSEVQPPGRPVAERLAPRSSPAGSSAAETSLLFRRVLVPEAQIKDWPRSNLRYLPIDAAEFERLLEGSRRTTDGSRPPADAQILQARYTAELADDELVAGRAVLRVSSFSKSPTLLPLDPCRLALDTPLWRPERSSNSAGAAKTVSLGIGPDGKLAVRVAQSGQLEFSWTLRGQRETGGALAFSLQLPQCPSNQLELTLPADLIPTVDQALVSAPQGTDSAAGLSAAATGG